MHVFCLRFWIRPADITRRSRDELQEPQSSWISAVADARCHIISWSNYNRVPGANLWRIFFWLKNPLCATGFCDASIERVCLHAPAAWELQRRGVLSCEALSVCFFQDYPLPQAHRKYFCLISENGCVHRGYFCLVSRNGCVAHLVDERAVSGRNAVLKQEMSKVTVSACKMIVSREIAVQNRPDDEPMTHFCGEEI